MSWGRGALLTVAGVLLSSCMTPLLGSHRAPGPHYVGVLYETWFNHMLDDGQLEVPTYPLPAASNGRRYWGNPAVGKYLSEGQLPGGLDAADVYNHHADLLADAKVDFLLVDYSNGNILDYQLNHPLQVLVATYLQRLADNKPTPKLVFLINARETDLQKLDAEVYQPNNYREDLFFYYEGKPLLCPLQSCSFPVTARYTLRPTWGLLFPGDNSWSFLEPYPQRVAVRDGVAEEMPVSAAQQASHMTEFATARGRLWSYASQGNTGREGENFDSQWKLAQMVGPRFVLVKSWNEWITYGPHHTDEYNREFSNDLEPMADGHGDWYYQSLKRHIAEFKGVM
jgi:hypothetical protein